MAKIIFAPVHVAGHFFPTIPVAHALKKRGHEVIYTSEINMKDYVEGEGFTHHRVGPGVWAGNLPEKFPQILKLRGNPRIHFILKEVYLGLAPYYIKDLLPIVKREKPDLMLFDCFSYPGRIVAEMTNTPWVTMAMFLGLIPSWEMPPYSFGLPPPKNLLQKLAYGLGWQVLALYIKRYDRIINRIRKDFGLPPVYRAFLDSAVSPYLYLAFTSFGFEYYQKDLPPQIHLVGPSLWNRPRNYQPPDWLAKFPEKRPAVYITIGTVESVYERSFFRLVMEAFQSMPDVQGLMTVCYPGKDINGMGIPPNLRIEQYVPNSEIIPKVDLVVHHAGFNTTMDCLVHSKPAVAIPMEGDQHENGRRVQVFGVGYRVPYRSLTPEKLRQAIRKALKDESLKANVAKLSQQINKLNGPETSADLIEKFLKTGKPVYRSDGDGK